MRRTAPVSNLRKRRGTPIPLTAAWVCYRWTGAGYAFDTLHIKKKACRQQCGENKRHKSTPCNTATRAASFWPILQNSPFVLETLPFSNSKKCFIRLCWCKGWTPTCENQQLVLENLRLESHTNLRLNLCPGVWAAFGAHALSSFGDQAGTSLFLCPFVPRFLPPFLPSFPPSLPFAVSPPDRR